ncbi:Uncharacterized protein TCM_008253 [Theobroma cacao]|uniref:Uncharacterized protein n=1 Tax=Theobroma cacao TaxID=3641 RepID=A0A061EB73_THECC|nr:Uncharacterized protein TCM_008253 [Theobroma cacao]
MSPKVLQKVAFIRIKSWAKLDEENDMDDEEDKGVQGEDEKVEEDENNGWARSSHEQDSMALGLDDDEPVEVIESTSRPHRSGDIAVKRKILLANLPLLAKMSN